MGEKGTESHHRERVIFKIGLRAPRMTELGIAVENWRLEAGWWREHFEKCTNSDVIQLQAHSVVDFVVFQCDVVLEDAVPDHRVGTAAQTATKNLTKVMNARAESIKCGELQTHHF